MKYKEVELKYSAENIPLTVFKKFCEGRNPRKLTVASGYDHFFSNTKDKDAFCRHRVGPDLNQLTFKRKTSDINNYIRTEHNIDLQHGVKKDQIEALCAEFGYAYNTSIFKTCFVYKFDYYTFVYYVCYDVEMQETGRFFEIEAAEDYQWKNETEAWEALMVLEKFSRPLGISAQGRIKKSLWEMVRK